MANINIRQKGANAEREICLAMNAVILSVMKELGYTDEERMKAVNAVQRNQNQSAVGGNDLTNTFGMSIEVKRQETLSINTWWRQCAEAAKRNNEHPVLLYRQSRQPWRCVTMGMVNVQSSNKLIPVRVEMEWDSFLIWFKEWVYAHLSTGGEVRT